VISRLSETRFVKTHR